VRDLLARDAASRRRDCFGRAAEASGIGLLDPGDTVDVICLRGDSWAKLDEGSWVPEQAVQAEVDAEPAPDC
jgi:hypothetical protein